MRPLKRLAQQTRQIDAGDEAPDVEVRGATEAVEIADAVNGMLQRIWKEQDRTKAALASARDFASVSAHELRTPLTAMRTNLEVLATLDLPEEQRKEVVNDVIRTQSRIEATLRRAGAAGAGRAVHRPTTTCRSTSPNCSTAPRTTRCASTPISTCRWCPRRR